MKIRTNEDLRKLYDKLQIELSEIRSNFPWTNKDAYISWLVQSYEYAYNSTRILAMTGGKMPRDKTKYSNRFISHAAEEKGHEKLLENDVKSFGLGMSMQEVLPQAKAFHQSLYYWLGFDNPVGMFGWVLALEGFAVKNVPQMYEVCLSEFGPKATSFLKVHAQEDEDHLEKAFKSINDFTPEENQLVGETMYQYSCLYGEILKKITERYGTKSGKKAA